MVALFVSRIMHAGVARVLGKDGRVCRRRWCAGGGVVLGWGGGEESENGGGGREIQRGVHKPYWCMIHPSL